MDEYQINVSANGCFMFRTEWDSDGHRVAAAAVTLEASMPLARVTVVSRSKIMREVKVEKLLES